MKFAIFKVNCLHDEEINVKRREMAHTICLGKLSHIKQQNLHLAMLLWHGETQYLGSEETFKKLIFVVLPYICICIYIR